MPPCAPLGLGLYSRMALCRFMGPAVIIFAFAKPFLKTLQQVLWPLRLQPCDVGKLAFH